MHNSLQRVVSAIIAIVLLTGMACNLVFPESQETATPQQTSPANETPSVQPPSTEVLQPVQPTPTFMIPLSSSPRFAAYRESAGNVAAQLKQDEIMADLSNVRIPYMLSQAQIEKLSQVGFVVSPGQEKEFFTLYEKARYDNLPVFVTSDSLLHVYHLMFSKVLRTAESNYFIPLLRQMNQALIIRSDEIYRQLQGTGWEDAARRTVAYIGVASRLVDPAASIPTYAQDLVDVEVAQINAASGILPSPLFPGLESGEDYTQYIPRGHYTKTEELKAYFRAMMWYGRMTFRLKALNPDVGKAETRSALLLAHTLRTTQVNGLTGLQAWADLYSPTVFFVGRSDDLTVLQYSDVMDSIYGNNPDLQSLVDEGKLDQFINLAVTLPAPRILGMVIVHDQDEEQLTKGLRFMGQRFVPDAYIFRQLVFDNVSTLSNRRGLPKGLDLFSAMGSQRAYQHLDQAGDTQFEAYPQQMGKVRNWLTSLSIDEWTETLYNTWLYTFFPLIQIPMEGYPSFMRSEAWQDKQLNTVLGSWAELKHDTVLYAKQVYAELGGGPPPPPPAPPKGYVEPVPVFYARLAALTEMTREGLETRGLLSEEDKQGLLRLETLARDLHSIAASELYGDALKPEDYERIRFYGGELEELTMLASDKEGEEQPGTPVFMEEEQQAAVIADVATDPDPGGPEFFEPIVLEVGVGRINEIFAVVPVVESDGSQYLQVAKGGVFSYYEFPWPASDRLTDEKWREMLTQGQAPALQPWTSSFYVEQGEFANLSVPIISYHTNVTYLFWSPSDSLASLDANSELFRAELQSLASQKQYVGHQLLYFQVRSVDIQSNTQAVVTVREVWHDKLYSYSGDYPTYEEEAIAERGPYSLDVTYTLELVESEFGSYWQTANVAYANQIPGW